MVHPLGMRIIRYYSSLTRKRSPKVYNYAIFLWTYLLDKKLNDIVSPVIPFQTCICMNSFVFMKRNQL